MTPPTTINLLITSIISWSAAAQHPTHPEFPTSLEYPPLHDWSKYDQRLFECHQFSQYAPGTPQESPLIVRSHRIRLYHVSTLPDGSDIVDVYIEPMLHDEIPDPDSHERYGLQSGLCARLILNDSATSPICEYILSTDEEIMRITQFEVDGWAPRPLDRRGAIALTIDLVRRCFSSMYSFPAEQCDIDHTSHCITCRANSVTRSTISTTHTARHFSLELNPHDQTIHQVIQGSDSCSPSFKSHTGRTRNHPEYFLHSTDFSICRQIQESP